MIREFCQRMFGRSLWVFHANSGGCNGCDIEVLDALSPWYDAERFGLRLVASPRHADVLLCQGPALRATAAYLRRAYDAMPAPKLVFAIGSCAIGGGLWFDSYAVLGPIEKILPVHYRIPGCPPRPEAILYGVALALGKVTKEAVPVEVRQEILPVPRYHAVPGNPDPGPVPPGEQPVSAPGEREREPA